MRTQTFSYARQHLASTMDIVVDNHTPMTITRQNKEPVVMMSLKDYQSIQETSYLMQSANNANRINSAIAELEAGLGTTKKLIEK
jgi:antitoxin YefM